jgi:protoporphyrinogen oxidase
VTTDGAGPHAVIIGAGFCGLTAAHELAKRGIRVTVLEQEPEIGGLAGSFVVNGTRLEKFYHHWFTSDHFIVELIHELGAGDQIVLRSTRTGIFYANSIFRLSSPLDVLRFDPLPPIDRIRLGLLAVRARRIRDWRKLENLSAAKWLRQMTGKKVYEVVWEPLLRGKFGLYAEDVSAVWFWNKLKLRGGSRSKGGGEKLAYYRGGFAALADRLAAQIRERGGTIRTGAPVTQLVASETQCLGVVVEGEFLPADIVVATPALPIVADLLAPHLSRDYVAGLRRIKYLANLCLVLELDRSLSRTYWLNVNDPEFPFVGVIEHTNFEPPETYGGRHVVYLSKYLPETESYFRMSNEEVLSYTLPYLKRIFPTFDREWIRVYHVWRARHSQPVVECNYSQLIPTYTTPLLGLYIASMAQIYPEDRGTNYAVREGRRVAACAVDALKKEKRE